MFAAGDDPAMPGYGDGEFSMDFGSSIIAFSR
jgi:hypothetical protein